MPSQFEKIHQTTSDHVDKYLRKLQFTLPILFIVLAAAAFTQPIGGLLAVVLGLPWSYLASFIDGPLFYFFPNLSQNLGMLIGLIIPLVINVFLLYKLGIHLNKKLSHATNQTPTI